MARRKIHKEPPPAPDVTKVPRERVPELVSIHMQCELTAEELAERSQEFADLLAERDRVEAAYKAHASAERKRVGGMDVRLRVLMRVVRDKTENRPITCKLRPNYTEGAMDIVRVDNGEVVDTRALTAEERQLEVPGS